MNRILNGLKLEKAYEKTFIGKIDRGFDFPGFCFSRKGRFLSEKSVHKFAKNMGLTLVSAVSFVTGKITPGDGAKISGTGSGCSSMRLRGLKKKGILPIPDSVSVYIRRWLIWVKSTYEEKNDMDLATTVST